MRLSHDDGLTSWLWGSFLGGLMCMGMSYGLSWLVPFDDRLITALSLLSGWWILGMVLNGVAFGLFMGSLPLLATRYIEQRGQLPGGDRECGDKKVSE